MVAEFIDKDGISSHDEFQEWRTRHQDSAFLNLDSSTSGNLHGTRCRHMGSGPPYFSLADELGSLTSKKKVCGLETQLMVWAGKNKIRVKRCSHCVRDKLIDPEDADGDLEEVRLAEEVASDSTYSEGGVQQILVNRFERDPKARRDCIAHYGAVCFICFFDFRTFYGTVMEGFIHVHHLRPLSSIGAEYRVDPIQDLRPVCPNCHAVAHRKDPPYHPEEVRELLKANRR